MQRRLELQAVSLGNFQRWTRILIQPVGPANVRIASERATVDAAGGITLLPGVVWSDWWAGPLYAAGMAAGTVIEFESLSLPGGPI